MYLPGNESIEYIPPNGKRIITFKHTLGGDMLVPTTKNKNVYNRIL